MPVFDDVCLLLSHTSAQSDYFFCCSIFPNCKHWWTSHLSSVFLSSAARDTGIGYSIPIGARSLENGWMDESFICSEKDHFVIFVCCTNIIKKLADMICLKRCIYLLLDLTIYHYKTFSTYRFLQSLWHISQYFFQSLHTVLLTNFQCWHSS